MQRYILRRILYGLISLWMLTIIIFLLIRITGDPALVFTDPYASKEEVQALRVAWGLDKPIHVQYYQFMSNAVRGNFGDSFLYNQPVLDLWLKRLPNSIMLAGTAFLLALFIGIPLGIISAVKVDSWWDSGGKAVAILGISLPGFWVGLLLIIVFAVTLGWLPSSGKGGIDHIIMPAVAVGWHISGVMLRMTRSGMLDTLGSEYIKFARLKGVPERMVLIKHAFKNALIPILTLFGLSLVLTINGMVIIEAIFAWPGIGHFLYQGISLRDYPVVQTTTLLIGAMVITANLLIDILYAYIDPRIRTRPQ